jgi:hypothetical protein
MTMNEDMIELARRAMASPHWRWMPGMLVMSEDNCHRPARIESLYGDGYGLTVVPHEDGPVYAAHHEYGIAGAFPHFTSVPDFTDPATFGCVLALARDAWDAPEFFPDLTPVGYRIDQDGPYYPDQITAIVAALEAAPEAGR